MPAEGLGIELRRGTLMSRAGCAIPFRLYTPARRGAEDALVVIGHGFLRSQERMGGLAMTLAAAGVSAVTLDFCNDRLWSGGHVQNGFDMAAVAHAQGARRIVYAGFSAGALAALVAARNDPRAVGVVALDLVDAQGLGTQLARGMTRPIIGLVGEPSACNAYNNGLGVYAASSTARVTRLPGADHCDFEPETDWLCRTVCEQAAAPSSAARREILERAVTAVAGLLTPHAAVGAHPASIPADARAPET